MVHQHLQRIEQRQLAARGEDALLNRVVRAEIRRVALHHRLAHRRHPGHRGVAREVLLDGLDRRVLDVLRRREMRLARTEVRKVNALRLHLQRFSGNRHRGRNFDAVDAVGKDLRGCCNGG